ncbi:MAG: RsmE family RNA methyltransferase [Verrucomicrobiaceae bacterium]|jgi:16S rRNA (uracil1498-N3)-methyltransferase|nr:RsmE family RNA methyltransferase [Verrucomicrobiaceae bacterium]
MSLSRFYLAADQWSEGGVMRLGEEEAHHCTRVLRKRVGDEVEVFDGCGRVARSRILVAKKDDVVVQVELERRHEALGHEVHVLPALIKGEAFEWLLEKAVELGAASVRPVITANSVVQWDAAQGEKKMAKWRRHMLEAAKQCHTPFLPELREPVVLAEALGDSEGEMLMLVPALFGEVRSLAGAVGEWGLGSRRAMVLIGPEGDFLVEELAAAVAAGFQPVTLGPLILRAETAVVATLAFLTQVWVGKE